MAEQSSTTMITEPVISDGSILIMLNKAQLVMLDEEGLIDHDLVGRLADALAAIEPVWPGDAGDYLACERSLIEHAGPDASNLHLGRSRNDIGATRERIWLRHALLDTVAALVAARQAVQHQAERNAAVTMPSYTHAVQAQPISVGHYLLALDASLSRDAERLISAYQRIDRSPLGAGALGTSGFPLNRERLAELLGFTALNENSYDCIGVASADTKIEFAGVLGTSAINVGRFCSDLVAQHAPSNPGITVTDEMTGGSSIMPNKRNPKVLEALRASASLVVGRAQGVATLSHNTPFGDVGDVRTGTLVEALAVAAEAGRMYRLLRQLMDGLVVDEGALQRIVSSDFSTMTELADTLFRDHQVPFRIGHEVAKEVANHGRRTRVGAPDVPYRELQRIYHDVTGTDLPLTQDGYRRVVDADQFVQGRVGRGGPQRAEVARMLRDQAGELDRVAGWRSATAHRLAAAATELQTEFDRRRSDSRLATS